MFFYLSQFLSFLALPLTITIILIVIGAFFIKRKWGKQSLWAGIILLWLFSNQFIANQAMLAWEPDFKAFSEVKNHEIGIVLTGVTNLSRTAYDRTFFNKGADRITHALQLYQEGKIKKILITGGRGLNPVNPQSEAEVLKRFLLMTGVPEADVMIEERSKNTRENALFTEAFLQEKGIDVNQEFMLITSAFHMKRSKGCFDKVGLRTESFPTDYYSSDTKFDIPTLFFPDPYSIFIWHKLVKEWIGILVYKLVGYL
ncbi:uncharacterized SAM-binding protein YcdF (DUF218 family) [Algoriphagus antarcticus]|uniref:Uncharacterized SAM-binding protein YcdF (DUF218 family) n=2 Tax=Algoriphagus antarcticus TaxID=238540 RepID=A0A3E0DV97_9BACT|nr:uncharacterized SAM-binding protein YcdF (DUF218 family) [Algoriphagus antarcticus]